MEYANNVLLLVGNTEVGHLYDVPILTSPRSQGADSVPTGLHFAVDVRDV